MEGGVEGRGGEERGMEEEGGGDVGGHEGGEEVEWRRGKGRGKGWRGGRGKIRCRTRVKYNLCGEGQIEIMKGSVCKGGGARYTKRERRRM